MAEQLLDRLEVPRANGGPALCAALQALNPALADAAPLLEAFLPLGLGDSETTARLSGERRAEYTQRALLRLLRRAVGAAPLVLVMEDAQWLDSASWALVRRLMLEVSPLLLVVGTRPLSAPVPMEFSALVEAPITERVVLTPLSTAESLVLAACCLGVDALHPALARLVATRADGHPFFSEELAYAARDAGLIRIDHGRCELAVPEDELERTSLPDTLQGAITARIDRLPPQQQLTLKVASMIGRMFALGLLRDVHPIAADRPRLGEDLDALRQRNLTRLVERAPEQIFAFEHAVTQDVAYELMSFSQRRRLHRAVAEQLEGASPEARAHLVPRLAHHWARSLDEREPEEQAAERALHYLELAGERALLDFANEEAAGFFEEALGVDERLGRLVSPRRRAGWERCLGLAYLQLGRMPSSGEHLERSIAILDRPVPGPAGLALRLVIEVFGQLALQLRPGALGIREQGDAAAIEAARAYSSLFVVRYQANQALPTVHAALRGLALAARGAAGSELADGLATLCLISGTVPLHSLARRYARQALALAERMGDPSKLSWVLEVLGVYAIGAGRWAEVQVYVERAAAIADRMRDGRRWEETHAVLAWLSYFQGNPREAAERWRAVAQAAQQRRDPQPRIWGLCGMVEAGWLAGVESAETALGILAEARGLLPDDMYRAEAIRVLGVEALHAARSARLDQAQAALVDALARIQGLMPTTFYSFEGYAGATEVAIGLWVRAAPRGRPLHLAQVRRALRSLRGFARVFPIARPRTWLLRGLAAHVLGHRASAQRCWQRGLGQALELGMPVEHLRLLATQERCSGAETGGAAATLAASLGIDLERAVPWWEQG